MHPEIPIIPVFIASPSDVALERNYADKAVKDLCPLIARLFGVSMYTQRWEEFAPISSHDGSAIQFGILNQISPNSIFIGILHSRYGTPVKDTNETGTEMEFDIAIKHRDSIKIMSYFRKTQSLDKLNSDEKKQLREVNKLKKRLHAQNVAYCPYLAPEDFESRIFKDLLEAVLSLIFNRESKKALGYSKFFRFGSKAFPANRPLMIVYPPITDPGLHHIKPILNWQKRLLPHIVYEDSKAIQDIEEVMRILRRNYKTVTTDSQSLNPTELGDKIWVCVPRNSPGQVALNAVEPKERVRFSFNTWKNPASVSEENYLIWTTETGEVIKIHSPLAQYLTLSLSRPKRKTEWLPSYGNAYCRDYAILARFKILRDPQNENSEYFYHYFVGGIRGLGTWGVGHLIDHENEMLTRMSSEAIKRTGNCDDVQLLIEVTYQNYTIIRIKDVTNEMNPSLFFKERESDEYIKLQLKNNGVSVHP